MGVDIALNYREAHNLAVVLDSRAGELASAAQKIEAEIIDGIGSAWTETGGAVASVDLVSGGIKSRTKALREAADELSAIAHAIDRTATKYKLAEEGKGV